MAEIKKISLDRIIELVNKLGFNARLLAKDYYITVILFLLKDVKGIYFKGGTAIQKIFLNYSRLSEDADYTVVGDVDRIQKQIAEILEKFFDKITRDKSKGPNIEGFVRLIAHYSYQGRDDVVFVDLNRRAKLTLKSENHKIRHFYDEEIPIFSVDCVARDEMFAEKMAATIARNKPRDHFDIYKIIQAGWKIDEELVAKKCRQSGVEFDKIKMFNRANKLHNRWDDDMKALLAEEVNFQDVIKMLADYFDLKSEKQN